LISETLSLHEIISEMPSRNFYENRERRFRFDAFLALGSCRSISFDRENCAFLVSLNCFGSHLDFLEEIGSIASRFHEARSRGLLDLSLPVGCEILPSPGLRISAEDGHFSGFSALSDRINSIRSFGQCSSTHNADKPLLVIGRFSLERNHLAYGVDVQRKPPGSRHLYDDRRRLRAVQFGSRFTERGK
jgi:hypothetical protein